MRPQRHDPPLRAPQSTINHAGRPTPRAVRPHPPRCRHAILRLAWSLSLAIPLVFLSCGGRPGPTECPTTSTSTRVDTSSTSCPIYGDTAWTDTRLADVDSECMAFMSTTDAHGLARLAPFCRCLSTEMSRSVDFKTYEDNPARVVAETYKTSGEHCSARAEYGIPSRDAGGLFTPESYESFISTCLSTGSTRAACRCLAVEDSREHVGRFEDSSEVSSHRCAVIRGDRSEHSSGRD